MYRMDIDEYEERYGEHVGYCRTHKHRVVDDWCEDCEDEIPYDELISECCGAYPLGALDGVKGMCGECNEMTMFIGDR